MVATPKCEMVATPKCEMVATPKCEMVATPKCKMVATPRCEMVTTPRWSATPKCEMVATPSCEMVTTPSCEMVTTPRCEMVATPKMRDGHHSKMVSHSKMRDGRHSKLRDGHHSKMVCHSKMRDGRHSKMRDGRHFKMRDGHHSKMRDGHHSKMVCHSKMRDGRHSKLRDGHHSEMRDGHLSKMRDGHHSKMRDEDADHCGSTAGHCRGEPPLNVLTWNAANLTSGVRELALKHILDAAKAVVTEVEMPETGPPIYSVDGYTTFLPVLKRKKFLKMPKVSCPTALIREFGGSRVWEHHAQTQTLFCKLCTSHFDYKRKSLLASHVQTAKHKKHVELLNKGEASQQQLLKTVVTRPPFVTDLARMLVACNIPLNNVDKPEFIKFFENHVQKALPSRAILTKCMEEDSKELLRKIKSKLLNKDLVVQVDETTDLQGRSMTAVLVSPLDGQTLERPFLIHVMDVVNNNNVTLQQAVVKALHGLMGDDLDYDRVRLFLTDGAAYCLKAGRGLLALFPNLIHVTCLAHALSRVAEVARTTYPKGTWLEAAFYYAEHFHTIKAFVEVMEDDSQAIVEAKKLFKDPEILPQLAILKGNFPVLVHTITALEGRLPLVKSMELVDELQEKLTLEPFAEKLKTVLKKNPGLDKMRKVAKVLKGSQEDFEGNDPNTTANLANAPMVTCDVERTFSALRDLNTPKRARLSEEHIKDVLIIQWNFIAHPIIVIYSSPAFFFFFFFFFSDAVKSAPSSVVSAPETTMDSSAAFFFFFFLSDLGVLGVATTTSAGSAWAAFFFLAVDASAGVSSMSSAFRFFFFFFLLTVSNSEAS
eukprot:maker-scaffold476_size161517-snap-gene-0.44 protein:Tk11962 transcript:maker-scaffold476_size161517-snap-gene-0.44-mRNA-1 annotation:"PREDICTED: uncharacterized protein LOC100897181"